MNIQLNKTKQAGGVFSAELGLIIAAVVAMVALLLGTDGGDAATSTGLYQLFYDMAAGIESAT